MALAVAGPRITEASAFFMNELVKMEPGTENSGIYAVKPGYHYTRAGNIELDKKDNSSVPDYSIRLAADLKGPDDKAAAYDWTHEKAHSGNYASMAKYGARLLAAFNAKDPRLAGWREALGQTDTDATPEGLDFVTWTKRTPDGTHAWHWHFSELRAYVDSMINKLCMLSVLRGQSLADYLASGGQLIGGTAVVDINLNQLLGTAFPTDNPKRLVGHVLMDLQNLRNGLTTPPGATRTDKPGAVWVDPKSSLGVIIAAAQKVLADTPAPVVITPEDRAAIVDAVVDQLVSKLGALRFEPKA